MSAETLKQINLLLTQLTQSELDQVKMRVGSLRSLPNPNEQTPSADLSTGEVWVLQVIFRTALSLGIEGATRPLPTSDLAGLRAKLPGLITFLKQADGSRIHWRMLLSIGVELLHEDLTRQQIPTTAVVLVRHIHRVPAIIDKHFPGYARNGLLGLIIRSKENV